MTERSKSARRRENRRPVARKSTAFERRFRAAAQRVLRRHGIPEDRLESEIERLRRAKVSILLPTVEELERAFADSAEPS